jgi:hypothetical protein
MLNLAAWLTQRSIYEKPKDMRKGVWIDEAFFLSEVPTGRVLMNRFARDSRKWNVRVLLSSQIPADFLKIQGFVTLLDSVFIGRLDDDQAQADALRLLKVPVGAGYEQVVASLGRRPGVQRGMVERDTAPRQFIFGDGAGGVERIRIDLSGEHLEHLRTVMDTTPDAQREGARRLLPEAREQQQTPTPPSEYEFEPVDGSMSTDEEFERAAEFELGLTEDDFVGGARTELDPPAQDDPDRQDKNGEKKRGREDAA